MRLKSLSMIFIVIALSINIGYASSVIPPLTIHGCVKNQLQLTQKALRHFQLAEVQLNDIKATGQFKGAFVFRGVPLKTLLQSAGIEKKDTDFKKQVDLAVLLKDRSGAQAVLSWGEVFFKNPAHVIVALSAEPVRPHKGADHFKDKKEYTDMMAILNREITFPRLVIAQERFSDRCLEDIIDIEVVDLKPQVAGKKSSTVFSEQFRIEGDGIALPPVAKLPQMPRETILSHVVGMGRGYHGTHHFSGIPLTSMLSDSKIPMDLNTVFVVSAPDAYRALVSYGELFFNVNGDRVIVSDQRDGQDWDNGGKFVLILPDDLMADREVKAVSKIEVIRLLK